MRLKERKRECVKKTDQKDDNEVKKKGMKRKECKRMRREEI